MVWTTPVDPGGGNPGRKYDSSLIGAGWTNLSAIFTYTGAWSGSFTIAPGEVPNTWFNRFPQPPSPFSASDPNSSYVTTASDFMEVQTNNGGAGLEVTVELYGDATGPCSAGSQPQGGAPAFFTYTESDLAAVLPGNLGLIIWGLLGLPVAPQSTADFCNSPPPTDMPTAADYVKLAFPPIAKITGTYQRFANQVIADKWNVLCQCKGPGFYVPPGPPSPPAGFPSLPAGPTCTTIQDVCNELQVIYQTLTYLTQSLSANPVQPTVTLVDATRHSSLTGAGTLTLRAAAAAVRVEITTDVQAFGEAVGDPTYFYHRGFIVPIILGAPVRGLTQLTYNPQLYVLPPLTEQVGYTLSAGIVADIVELVPGP